MDVKALRIGQEVRLRSGCYADLGTVIRVGPLGVDVKADEGGLLGRLYQFNYEGIERDGQSTIECGV